MAAKRLALGLGVEKEETKQVLKDFYQLRDDLGYSLNVDLLAWLLRNALESKSQEEAGKPSRNSANNAGPTSKKQKVIVICSTTLFPLLWAVLLKNKQVTDCSCTDCVQSIDLILIWYLKHD